MSSTKPPVREPICNDVCDRLLPPRPNLRWVPVHYGLVTLLHVGAVLLFVWLASHPGSVLNTGLARGAVAPVRATLLSAEWLAAQRHARQRAQSAANSARESSFVAAKSAAPRDVPPAELAPLSASPQRRPALPKRHAPKPLLHPMHPPQNQSQTQTPALAKPRTAAANKPPMDDRPRQAATTQAQPERTPVSVPVPTGHSTPSAAVSKSRVAQPAAKEGAAASVTLTAMPVGGPVITQPHYRQPPQPEAYPPLARRRGWQGTVLIEVWLDGEGEQIKRQILQGSGHAVLDQAALRSVARNQFAPYTRNGIGQPARLHLPVIFSLSAP